LQIATGSVIDGKIVLDGATLPDGTIVTVLAPDHDDQVGSGACRVRPGRRHHSRAIVRASQRRPIASIHADMKKISRPEPNQSIAGAKKEPVIITDRGRPAHVSLTFEKDHRMTDGGRRIADLLAMPCVEDAEWEIPGRDGLPRPGDLS
jgi:hypothetical protein